MTSLNKDGDLLIYPEGDRHASPSAKMPKSSYFFDAIIRQEPIIEDRLNPEDNLEEYEPFSKEDIQYWNEKLEIISESDKAVVANFGGTGIGDIALVPATFLKQPRGIRDVAEWYISTITRPGYIKTVFEKQTDIALGDLVKVCSILSSRYLNNVKYCPGAADMFLIRFIILRQMFLLKMLWR